MFGRPPRRAAAKQAPLQPVSHHAHYAGTTDNSGVDRAGHRPCPSPCQHHLGTDPPADRHRCHPRRGGRVGGDQDAGRAPMGAPRPDRGGPCSGLTDLRQGPRLADALNVASCCSSPPVSSPCTARRCRRPQGVSGYAADSAEDSSPRGVAAGGGLGAGGHSELGHGARAIDIGHRMVPGAVVIRFDRARDVADSGQGDAHPG